MIMSAQLNACPGWTTNVGYRTSDAACYNFLYEIELMRRPHITRRAALAFAGLQRATDLLASAFAGRNFATDAGTILTVSPSKAA